MRSAKKGLLRTTVLAAALFGVYGVAAADGYRSIELADGLNHPVSGETFNDEAYSKIVLEDGTSLTIGDTSVIGNESNMQGAVRVLSGSTLNITDSTISNTTASPSTHGFGLQAVSRAASHEDQVTSINGSGLIIETLGDYGFGVQAFTEDEAGDRGN